MNKTNKTNKPLHFAILILIAIIGISFNTNQVSAAKAESETDKYEVEFNTITTGQESPYSMTMNYSYGYNFHGKYGRQIPIYAQLQNEGADFSGWLEVSIPLAENANVYRKEINLSSGEKTNISMVIPLVDGYGQIDVKLVEENYNIILESTNPIKLGNYEKILYAGVLSDNPEGLEYIDGLAIKPFFLKNDTFPEEKDYLDGFDILIINDVETSQLDNDQINAIYKWVLDGGSLVIGTGENANKVIPSLAEVFNIGTIDDPVFSMSNLDLIETPITNHVDDDYLENIKLKILRFEEERNLLRTQITDQNNNLSMFDNPLIPLVELSAEDWPSNSIDEIITTNITKTLANLSFSRAREFSLTTTMPSSQDSDSGKGMDNDQEISIYQKQALGKGNILLYNFNLSIEESSGNPTLEALITSSIINNLSDNKNVQLNDEINGSNIPYFVTSSMSYSDTENIPKVLNYIIILVIYILIIGPITYIIIKKTDKYSLLWIVVPVTAVVFTFIVYLAGNETRVEEPFVGYVEMRTYRQSDNDTADMVPGTNTKTAGKALGIDNNATGMVPGTNTGTNTIGTNSIVEEELYFSLTAPYNDNYTIELDSYYPNITLMGEGLEFPSYSQHQVRTDPYKYRAAINYKDNETILEVNNNPAFSPVFFQGSNEYKGSNPIEAYINYTGDKIDGYVTNTSNYDITNAIYVGDSFLFNIGTIGSGKTVELDDVEKVYIYEVNDIYSDEIIDRVISGDGDSNRKRDLLYYLVDMHFASYPHKNCVIGFAEDWEHGSFTTKISDELKIYGTKSILSEVSVDYSKKNWATSNKERATSNKDDAANAKFVPSIAPLVGSENMTSFGLSSGYSSKYYPIALADEETILEYYFHRDEQVRSIEYYELSNQKPVQEYYMPFTGKVYALNSKTHRFDQIFSAKISANTDTTLISENQIDDYLNDENVLTLRYEPNYRQMDSMMLLPNISYWKGDK